MGSSGQSGSLSRKRILANVQDRKTGETPEVMAEEDADVAARNEAAERILSKPVKAKSKKTGAKKSRAKKPPGRSTTQVVLLAAIGIGGIAAIIGLRYLAEAFGVNWVGD